VADLAHGIPDPKTEESLGGLISSLRRLEAHGLLLTAIPQRRKKIKSYRADQELGINRWLYRDATLLPRGQKLVQLLKDCAEAVGGSAREASREGRG
jgi:hypothetical protein